VWADPSPAIPRLIGADPSTVSFVDYDPFARGAFPVGVRTVEVYDPDRDRRLPTEIWYPAAEEYAGQDLDDTVKDMFEPLPEAPPSFQKAVRDATPAPVATVPVAFSHTVASHRRQSTFLCTHLASHGYLVASPDHVGTTMADLIDVFLGGPSETEILEVFIKSGLDRPLDMACILDHIDNGQSVGAIGHGFGAWTVLTLASRDNRIGATVPIAPAGGEAGTLAGIDVRDTLDLEWGRQIPTLFLAAELDSLIPLPGVRDLYARLRSADAMGILGNADHWHFCDSVEDIHDLMLSLSSALGLTGMRPSFELCSGELAHEFTSALVLAHLDEHLKGHDGAEEFLGQDLNALFADRETLIEFERRQRIEDPNTLG
jgi:predicted dienelactone hydrolase